MYVLVYALSPSLLLTKIGRPFLPLFRYNNPLTNDRMYFTYDPMHIFKNVRNALFTSMCASNARYFAIGRKLLEFFSPGPFDPGTREQRAAHSSDGTSAYNFATHVPAEELGDPVRVHFGYDQVTKHYKTLDHVTKYKDLLKETGHCFNVEVWELDSKTRMQVELVSRFFDRRVIDSFKKTAHSAPDDPEWKALVLFMEATHAIFVDFFMHKGGIQSLDSWAVKRLCWGFNFFRAWFEDHQAFINTPGLDTAGTHTFFLDMAKTWQELRQTIVGTIDYMNWHFQTYPGSRVYPMRMSQSALEGKFGFARGMQPGTGKLELRTLLKAFTVEGFLFEDTVSTRFGEMQAATPQGTKGVTTFTPLREPEKRKRKRRKLDRPPQFPTSAAEVHGESKRARVYKRCAEQRKQQSQPRIS
jgi:hypothetical protein